MKRSIIALFLFISFYASSQRALDSLWCVWNKKAEVDTVRMQALYEICRDYYIYSNPDTSLILSQQLYTMANEKGMMLFKGKVLNNQLSAYVTLRDYPKAMACGREAIKLFTSIRYYRGVCAMAENIGTIYMKHGDYPRALDLFFKGLALKTHLNDSLGLPGPMINIATIYANMGNLDSALSYNERALTIAERHGGAPTLFAIVGNLGNLYQRSGHMDKALIYYERSQKIAEAFGNGIRLAWVYHNFMSFYREQSDFEKALDYQKKALAICQQINSPDDLAENMHLLSTVYFKMGQFDKAQKSGEDALRLLPNDAEPARRRDMYSDLGNVYYAQKKFEKALALQLRFTALKDSIRNDSLTNRLLADLFRSESEKKQLLIKAETDKQLLAIKVAAENNNFKKNMLITIAVILLFTLGTISYFSYRHWRQKNIIADQTNQLLSEKLLLSQMNPHFIFNSLNAIQNYIFKQDHYLAGTYLKQFAELMRMILEFSRKDLITLEQEHKFLVSYLEIQKLRFGSKLNYRIEIDKSLDVETVMIPPMLGQPFAENALEHGLLHTHEDGILIIRIKQEGKHLLYEIEDNGIGIVASKSLKKSLHQSLATDITRERLTVLHRKKTDLEIIDKNSIVGLGTGVIVKFVIP